MPYLDGDWEEKGPDEKPILGPDSKPIVKEYEGLWVPEIGWDDWKNRARGLPHQEWRKDEKVPKTTLEQLASLKFEDKERYLSVLGSDLGSVQRDNFFYANFAEQLKHSPDDATAEKALKTMEQLGFTSVTWDYAIGGPPPHQSFRPWQSTLNWLISNMAKVGRIILKIADFVSEILVGGRIGISAISVSAALPPEITFEWPTGVLNEKYWPPVRQFLEKVIQEFAKKLREG